MRPGGPGGSIEKGGETVLTRFGLDRRQRPRQRRLTTRTQVLDRLRPPLQGVPPAPRKWCRGARKGRVTAMAPAPASVLARPQRRLRGSEPSDRNAERRTGDIVEPDLLAERDRGRITTMLTADAKLDIGAGRPAALGSDLDQFANTVAVERDERILL